jgi:type I restriction enzyme R subunit
LCVFLGASATLNDTKAYGALSPDPRVLPYLKDLKLVASILHLAPQVLHNEEPTNWKTYSEKIREMLNEHLDVVGLKMVCKLRSLSDPTFWNDFDATGDLKMAAVRKLTELKKETRERAAKNPARYDKFSDRIKQLIKEFNAGLLDAAKALDTAKAIAEGVVAEDGAHKDSGLPERAFDVHAILQNFKPSLPVAADEPSTYDPTDPTSDDDPESDDDSDAELTTLEHAALAIDALYASSSTAPAHWQDKTQLKKGLRRHVRLLVKDLGLEGWAKDIPNAVERYAVLHYSKP